MLVNGFIGDPNGISLFEGLGLGLGLGGQVLRFPNGNSAGTQKVADTRPAHESRAPVGGWRDKLESRVQMLVVDRGRRVNRVGRKPE